jgi:uncharacterized protein (TIGR02421 family)
MEDNGAVTAACPILLEEPMDTPGARLVRAALALKRVLFRTGGARRDAPVRLRHGDVVADGVLAILVYLEGAFPRWPLLPEDAPERARAVRLLELALPALDAPRLEGSAVDEATRATARGRLAPVLLGLERCLEEAHGEKISAFAVGKAVSLGGLAVAVVAREADALGVDLHAYPRVHRVLTGAGRLPEVTRAYHPVRAGYVDKMSAKQRDAYLDRVRDVLGPIAGRVRFLDTIGWKREVEEEFFEHKARRLPKPTYAIDKDRWEEAIATLEALHGELAGEHVLLDWLRATVRSFIDAHRMLLAVGTRDFYRRSLELYGGAATTAFDRDSTNLDLAEHIERRLGDQAQFVETEALDTDAFVAFLEGKLAARSPRLELEIVRDRALSAKVICGRTKLRVREGARFGRAEAEGLWLHEVETHALTAQNGAAQRRFPLLRSGGPRTTRTQEWLAVFAELYGGALSSPRLLRIAQRVRLVGMAEDGASFLDLYRALVARGLSERDPYLDAQRICRGGVVEGGAPFTKDACYLAGLLDIYTTLRFVLARRSPLMGELYVTGRVHSEDLLALLWLRSEGVLEAPRFVPSWAANWDALLSYFAFASFLAEVDVDLTPNWPADVEEFVAAATKRFDEERVK